MPSTKEAVHFPVLQSSPAGEDLTRPMPFPETSTVTVNTRGGAGFGVNVALTCVSPESVSTQTMPEQAPPNPENA